MDASHRRLPSVASVSTNILIDDDHLEVETPADNDLENVVLEREIYSLCSPTPPRRTRGPIGLPPQLTIDVRPGLPPRQLGKSLSSRSLRLMPSSPPPPDQSPIPPVPPLPPTGYFQPLAFVTTPPRSRFAKAPPVSQKPQPETKPNDPPDVRKQLRQYLSPRKFDEALAFGFAFPTDEHPSSSSPTNQQFPVRPQPPVPGLTESDSGDGDSDAYPENLSPRTPTTSETSPPATKRLSFGSSVEIRPSLFPPLKSTQTRGPDDGFAHREMTIHMTLTRRDLRAPANGVYGVERPQTAGVAVERVDPLSLNALHICDDPSGAHGAFAVREAKGPNAFKRAWKSIRRN